MTDRLDRIRAAMAEAGLEALLISSPGEEHLGHETRRYVAGFTGTAAVILITPARAIIAADFRYVEQAERESIPRGFAVFAAKGKRAEWVPALFAEGGVASKQVGVTRDDCTLAGWVSLQQVVGGMPAGERPELIPAPRIIEQLRRHKDAEEMALVQRAIDTADAAFEAVERELRPDLTETAIADRFAQHVHSFGGDEISFPTIVAAGAWGAMPHAQPRAVEVGAGRPIVIDMGARFGGYCSDLTRTVVVGEQDARFREIYEIVFEAQRAAIEGVEPGMTGVDAHRLAWSVIDRAGYGEQFGHGLGHGVGLQVHEAPYLGETSEDTLEEGMIFTIEPGIYIPGWGGVRIEDIVCLEDGRARVLSHARKLTPTGATT